MQETWVHALEEEMAPHSSYSCLENPMHGGAWRATVHGVTESDTTEVTEHVRVVDLQYCVRFRNTGK